MSEVSTIGLDLSKSVFQVHGVDVDDAVVIRKRISRAKQLEFFASLPPCLVGIEACPTAHYWSRRLQALGQRFSCEAVGAHMRVRVLEVGLSG
jgi:transposase